MGQLSWLDLFMPGPTQPNPIICLSGCRQIPLPKISRPGRGPTATGHEYGTGIETELKTSHSKTAYLTRSSTQNFPGIGGAVRAAPWHLPRRPAPGTKLPSRPWPARMVARQGTRIRVARPACGGLVRIPPTATIPRHLPSSPPLARQPLRRARSVCVSICGALRVTGDEENA